MVDFRIRVVVDTSGAERGAKRVEDRLKRSTAAADRLRASLARAFGILGGGLFLRSAIRTLAQFDQALATVRAVSGATEAQFKALREEAQRLGRETRFSATQAAEGLVLLSRAGFTAAESLDTLDDTLLLAQAGALDLGQAAGITTATLRGFRLETDEASRVTDVLALAANSANTNVAQLGEAIKFVAPVAAGLKVTLETTTAALQSLSDAGLQGTLAGTGLRRVLAELAAPGTRLREVLARAGKTVADVDPQVVGLTNALEVLRQAGVNTGEALEIFGQRGGPAFEVLAANIGTIREADLALQGASGTARRLAEIQDDNLLGALLRVRSAFQGVILEFGEAERVGGPLRAFFESLARGLLFLADNIQIVINLAETLAIVLGVKLVRSLARLTAAIAANPIGLLVTALTVGTAALIGFSDQILATGDGLTTLADVISTAFRAIQQTIGPVLDSIAMSFNEVFGTEFEFTIREFVEAAAATFDTLVGAVRGTVFLISDLFTTQLGGVFQGTLASIQSFALSAQLFFQELGNGIINLFVDPVATIARAIQTLINSVAGAAAVAASLGVISEDERLAVEDTVAGIEGSINRLQNREPIKIFDTDATRRAIGDLDRESSEAFGRVGQNLSNAFKEGFEQDNFLGFIRSIFDQAEDEARARRAARPGPQRPGAPGAPGGAGGPTAPGGGAAGAGAAVSEFEKLLQAQEQEAQLLTRLIPLRGASAAALKLAAENGLDLTEVELERLAVSQRNIQVLQAQQAILAEIRGPQEQLAITQEALNELLAKGAISQEQFNQKLREAKIAALEADQSISGGFSRGLLKIEQQINDVGSLAESVLVNAFNNIEDALVNFVRTGEFEFEQFVNQLLDDIARLLIRLLILQAVQAATGLGGVGAAVGSAGAAAARQQGGPVAPNRPFLVGEEGPELFRPQGSGDIVPTGETAAMMAQAGAAAAAPSIVEVAAPDVNVNITNQSDPNEFKEAVDSGDLDVSIVNVLQRRKSASRQSLGV